MMICQRCLRASQPSPIRFVYRNRTPRKSLGLSASWGPSSIYQERSPTAIFKPTTLSFSTSVRAPSPQNASSTSSEPAIISSVPAGTPLKGLGYLKGKDPPIAKEDHEYPKWLWGLLDEGKKKAQMEGGADQGDSYSKSKKQRRVAARAALKAAKANPDAFAPKVPIEHQSIDLPAGDGTIKGAITAMQAREEVRDAMRKGRRKSIKEGNFLKAMR